MTSKYQKFVPIAEIASAVAVVISLVFVGLEIRNSAEQSNLNTQALQISAYQSLMESISVMNVVSLEIGELSYKSSIIDFSSILYPIVYK